MLFRVIISCFAVLYPLLVYFGLQHVEAKYIGVGVLILLAIRHLNKPKLRPYILALLIASTGIMWLGNSQQLLKFIPVLINIVMLGVFLWSLYQPPTIIETFARRMRKGDMPASVINYTRKVTVVWCLFFLINGTIAFYTAAYTSMAIWSLYNGLIAYVLMGCLFAGEYLFRRLFIEK